MSADGRKVEVALAKICFAVVVEQMELITAFDHEIARQIRARKGIRDNQEIGDYAFHDEIAANIFKTSVARQLMRTRQVRTKADAMAAHYHAGDMVRKLLEDAGLPTPELYATPAKSYQQLIKEQKVRLRLALEDRVGLWAQLEAASNQQA